MKDHVKGLFVGREVERDKLFNALGKAMVKRGNLVLISGEAGIGKSRLVEEFMQKAVSSNCICITGHCIPDLPLPYLPFIEAFKKGVSSEGTAESHGPFPKDKIGTTPAQDGHCEGERPKDVIDVSWSPDRILFSVLEFIKIRSRLHPLIILIEDLQWADSHSIQLLHFLARNVRTERVMILGTYRTEELLKSGKESPGTMFEALRLMRREDLVYEIELSGLGEENIGLLVQEVLGGRTENDIVEKVLHESEGNPLYAIETARVLKDTSAIRQDNGEWKIVHGKKVEVPPTIMELVKKRLESLNDFQKELLDVASVIGFQFEVELVQKVMGIPMTSLIEDLDNLDERNEFIDQLKDGYKFRHHVFRQLIYESLPREKRSQLHRSVGEVLESQNFEGKPAILALHFFEARDELRYVRYAVCAGEELSAKGDESGAIEYFNNSIKIIKRRPELAQYWLRCQTGLGYASNVVGNLDDSKTCLQEVIEKVGIENAGAHLLRIMAENYLSYGDAEKVTYYLSLAERFAEKDPTELSEIEADWATLHLWKGNFEEAELKFKQAIDWSLQGENRDLTTRLYCYLGDVYLTQGKVEQAMNSMEESMGIAEKTPSFYGEMEACYYSGMAYFHIGDWRLAIERIKKSIEIASSIGQLSSNCWSKANLSLVYDNIGDHKTALAEAKQSLEFAREIQSKYAMLLGLSGMIHVSLRNDMVEEARTYYEEAIKMDHEIKWSLHSTTRCYFMATTGEYLAAIDDWTNSEKAFTESFDLMRDTPNGILLEAMARTWFAESLVRKGDEATAIKQLDRAYLLYERLFNFPQMEKIRWMIGSLGTAGSKG